MLGNTVKDRVTGFSGVVTGVVHYLTGCSQALVQPPVKDGELKESHWFDVQRLETDVATPAIVLENGDTPGFDRAPPKR